MNRTSYEVWHCRITNLSHLWVFGCGSYALVNTQARQKHDEISKNSIFAGYYTQSKTYRLYNPLLMK